MKSLINLFIFFHIKYLPTIFSIGIGILLLSCQDFVDISPPTNQIVTETVFIDDVSATSAIDGVYSQMIGTGGFASGNRESITVVTGLSSDEFVNFSTNSNQIEFFSNSLLATNILVQNSIWKPAYEFIFFANSILEGLENSSGITEETRMQLHGEAKFIRAFCYFYLVNLFGDVPLIINTDFKANQRASRSIQSLVYEQIIADLEDAQGVLAEDYSFSGGERVRPNKAAASAMLARVYLYLEDWSNAEKQASSIIENSTTYNLLPNLNDVFLANNREAIWQLKPVVPGNNTFEALTFVIPLAPPVNLSLSNGLVSAIEPNDKRMDNWVNSISNGTNTYYFPFKYKISEANQPLTEYSVVLRLAEQYLIRAESRLKQGNLIGAQDDLNSIRNRAGLNNSLANDPSSLSLAIEKERRIELMAEWGHRWFDLKRSGRVNTVLAPVKLYWGETDIYYPIPQSEIVNNPNLTQNSGYQ
ncbi:MAG: RagB/SusD family nutrient uptake outer membrane protein [Cytophagales bacterium]|nr:RagB/SusD family nutrient uptake outer membrane protein [Cytophagales bacterium]